MHSEVDGRFEEAVTSTVDSTKHVVTLDLAHDVLHAQAPLVEDGVHGNLVRSKQAVVGLHVLDHDVMVTPKCPISHALFPRQEGRRVLFENILVVHGTWYQYGGRCSAQ